MRHSGTITCFLTLLSCSLANADTINVFTDYNSFVRSIATVNTTVTTETFDEFPTIDFQPLVIGTGSITLNGLTYAAGAPDDDWVVWRSALPVSPPNTLILSAISPITLTQQQRFTPGGIAFYLVVVSSFPPPSYQVDAKDDSGADFSITLVFSGTNPFFPGFSSDQGISSVTITPVTFAGATSAIILDNVSNSATAPEPPTVTLAFMAFAAMWHVSRRRSIRSLLHSR